MKRKLGFFIVLAFLFPILLFSYFHMLITKTAKITPPDDVPYIIVLGAKVNGKDMSLSLFNRAKIARNYLIENPETKVIVTGGQGPGEDITEAEALKRYFMKEGIQLERILVEDSSTSTFENLSFTKKRYNIDEAVVVSNDFHLYRSIELEKKVGIIGYPLAAETPPVVKTQLYVHEYLAILKMKLIGT